MWATNLSVMVVSIKSNAMAINLLFFFVAKMIVIVLSQDQYFQIQQSTTFNICLCCFYWVDCFGIRRKQREKLLSTSAECMNFTTVNQ